MERRLLGDPQRAMSGMIERMGQDGGREGKWYMRDGGWMLEDLRDRATLWRAQTGVNPLTVRLRLESKRFSDRQFIAV